MHFPPISLARKMLNCFCSNLKGEFGPLEEIHIRHFFPWPTIFFKVKECFKENENLGVLGNSAPSKALFFDFLHKDALWCILK